MVVVAHCSFVLVFPKLFLGYEECRGEFKRTPSKQHQQHQVAAIIDNQQPGEMCYTLYCCLYCCCFSRCSCSCCYCCRQRTVVVAITLYCCIACFRVVVLVLVVAIVVGGRWCAVIVFFLCRRPLFVVCRHPLAPILPFLLLSQCIVVSCCFVLFRVVSRCFALFRVVSRCFVVLVHVVVVFVSSYFLCRQFCSFQMF